MTDKKELPKGDIVFFDGRGDAVDGYSAAKVREMVDGMQTALEAQAAEIERLTIEKDKLDKAWHDIARRDQLEAEALQAEIERLKQQKETMRLDYKELELQLTSDENIERDRDIYKEKADALQAKLDAAQAQEPALIMRHQNACGEDIAQPTTYYASPVVQQPLTVEADALRLALATAQQSYPDPDEPEANWCLIERCHVESLCAAATKLYASPVVQQPLDLDVIHALWYKTQGDAEKFARAIEATHGIGGQQP